MARATAAAIRRSGHIDDEIRRCQYREIRAGGHGLPIGEASRREYFPTFRAAVLLGRAIDNVAVGHLCEVASRIRALQVDHL